MARMEVRASIIEEGNVRQTAPRSPLTSNLSPRPAVPPRPLALHLPHHQCMTAVTAGASTQGSIPPISRSLRGKVAHHFSVGR